MCKKINDFNYFYPFLGLKLILPVFFFRGNGLLELLLRVFGDQGALPEGLLED